MAKNILLQKELDVFFKIEGFLEIKRQFFKKKEIEKIANTMNKDPNFKSLFNKKVDLNKDKHLFSKNSKKEKFCYGMIPVMIF